MPCGLGQHPYFSCGSETRIDTGVTDVWTIDEHVLPLEKTPAEGQYDLAIGSSADKISITGSGAGVARPG